MSERLEKSANLKNCIHNIYDFFAFYKENPIMKIGSEKQMSQGYIEDEDDWSEKIETWELLDWLSSLTVEQHEIFLNMTSDHLKSKIAGSGAAS